MIGIDIIKVSRIESLLGKRRFLEKFFTKYEQDYIIDKNFNIHTVAGLIATKEAVSKAFGVGISKELGLLDIEIFHNENNAPYINTKNDKIKILMEAYNIDNINISISHDDEYAICICNLNSYRQKSLSDKSIEKKDDNNFYIPLMKKNPNKYDLGKVLIIGGSKGMTGSVILSSEAAFRTGSGIVYLLVPDCIHDLVEYKSKEQIVLSINDDGINEFGKFEREELLNIIQNKSVIAIGPGMGRGQYAKRILDIILNNFDGPIVVDADAIDLISEFSELLNDNIYLTPHSMEFSKLSNFTLNEIDYDRLSAVNNYIDRYDVNILLKGKNSIVANRNELYINKTGNRGMATAGSGDVLTGITASLLARENSFQMFKTACYIHGLAGDYAAKRYGKTSMIASDIISFLPDAIGEIDDN